MGIADVAIIPLTVAARIVNFVGLGPSGSENRLIGLHRSPPVPLAIALEIVGRCEHEGAAW